jgi:hypothetical protein
MAFRGNIRGAIVPDLKIEQIRSGFFNLNNQSGEAKMKLHKQLVHIMTLFVFSVGVLFPFLGQVGVQPVLAAPPSSTLSFQNNWTEDRTGNVKNLWHYTSASGAYATRYSDRVELDCTRGINVVLQYDFSQSYNLSSLRFDFRTNFGSKYYYIFSARTSSPLKGVNLGARSDGITDFVTQQTIPGNHFFYLPDVNSSGAFYDSGVLTQPNNATNTAEFLVTPVGGYARINKVNLSYLEDTKDRGGGVIHPVNYASTSYNQLQIGCPRNEYNTASSGILTIYNPIPADIQAPPTVAGGALDRKAVFKSMAKSLLLNNQFIGGPFTYRFDDPIHPYPNSAQNNSNTDVVVLPANVYTRIAAIKALAFLYLYNDISDSELPAGHTRDTEIGYNLKYAIDHGCVQDSTDCGQADQGGTYSTIALAYWLTKLYHPSILANYNITDTTIQNKMNGIVNGTPIYYDETYISAGYPVGGTHYEGNGFSDNFSFTGGFLGVTGSMYSDSNYTARMDRAKCFIWHSATLTLESAPTCTGVSTQTLNSNGTYSNHGYTPHPDYAFGASLAEAVKATIAFGSWSNQQFGSSITHAITNLWNNNKGYIDFDHNLWNSGNITGPSLNFYKTYSKTDNWLDPLNSINGIFMGSVYYGQYADVDKLLNYGWYISKDYGAVPFDPGQIPADGHVQNITRLLYQESNGTALNTYNQNAYYIQIYPATSIERYILSAMLIDQSLGLSRLP